MITLYRATTETETGIPSRSCWTPDYDVAVVYTTNPGFGGPHIREITVEDPEILDMTGPNYLRRFEKLAEALGYDDPREEAREWLDSGWRYPWEESGAVARRLNASGYEWLRYEDDYPDGAITMMCI